MKFSVITIFPELFDSFLSCSLVAKAIEKALIKVEVKNLRDFTTDKHSTVDDTPYGGGPGMVMKPEPWFAAMQQTVPLDSDPATYESIYFTPRGERLTQKIFEELGKKKHLIMMCGRYEEIDDRVRQHWATREISLGDYVINGGELAAQILIEGITRLLPGAIGDQESALNDSFSSSLLDHRHYTKPREFEGKTVPDVLTSGNHEAIRKWRLKDSLEFTLRRRPDLLENIILNEEEQAILRHIVESEKQEKNPEDTEN